MFGNDYQFRLIMMSTTGLILRRYMAENSKNVETSQIKTKHVSSKDPEELTAKLVGTLFKMADKKYRVAVE